ncbi:MAG: diadenylate cyclase CdaA [Oscillospiraceae bacterium]|nr:diadenylate cyclase CdaA [Oscillospiraceae bacterium]
MDAILEFFTNLTHGFIDVMSAFNFPGDLLDVLLVAALIYGLIVQLRKTQSVQIIKGIALVGAIYAVVVLVRMPASSLIFNRMFNDMLVILVVIFAPEIRQALERVGQSKLKDIPLFGQSSGSEAFMAETVEAVTQAADSMSGDSVGSLMVLQRKSNLGDFIKMSAPVDSLVTSEMLKNIFFPSSPLHDGAVIISESRIIAARCIIPIKNDRQISDNVGTRHRAALEIACTSDAVAVVTSEETGIISIACDGELVRDVTRDELREKLLSLMTSNEGDSSDSAKKRRRKKTR